MDTNQQNLESNDIFVIIKQTFLELLTKPGIILMSTFVLMILWGPKGSPFFMDWFGEWIHEIPERTGFRTQIVSFVSGFILLIIIPFLIIKFRFKEKLTQYGLGLGNVKLGLQLLGVVLLISIPIFYFGTFDDDMQNEYPMLYQNLDNEEIKAIFSWSSFLLYQLIYLLFFFVIEWVFRGYMLFGLHEKFGRYAVLIQMLSYTAWHLPKPTAELLGTPFWGFGVAAVTLRVGSMWYIFIAHWILNMFLDIMILMHKGVI